MRIKLKLELLIKILRLNEVQVSVSKLLQVERGDFSESDASSMSGKIEYLEKYSIAPPPSRDYYGLRVLGDQVILYRWKISHGPHKLPIVRTINFDDFTQDDLLQDEIRRIFGTYLLKHVRRIASGRRNTLLTLPKCVIERLIRYLSVHDIVKLSALSHVAKEIFDDNFVWEVLYRKYKPLTRKQYDSTSYNWKKLFQQAQMQGLIKVPRARPLTKQSKTTLKGEDSTKILGSTPKSSSKLVPFENQTSRKLAENVQKKIIPNPVSRKSSDSRLDKSAIEKEKEKKASTVRPLQMTALKTMKALRPQPSVTRIESKLEIKETLKDKSSETKLSKMQNRTRKIDAKLSNASLKMEDKEADSTKSKVTGSKNTKNEKCVVRASQGDQSKTKPKNKAKKIGQSKSTILSTSAALLDDQALRSSMKNDCLNLADLIEASLKNIRSPRTMFDSSFEKSKFCGGDSKLHEPNVKVLEHSRKLLRSGRANETLDRLSEKSEPLTAKSDSVHKSDASPGSANKTANVKTKKAVPNKHEFDDELEFDSYFQQYYNKHVTPSSQEQKNLAPGKPADKMSVLRSLGAKNSYRKVTGVGSVPQANRYEVKKAIGSFYK